MAQIDDIDYLLENSEVDSFLVYLDSSQRDYTAYPHPSQYVVNFDKPFRNVIGYSVLDSAVSTTMYNIESYNNFLVISQLMSSRLNWNTSTDYLGIFDELSYITEFLQLVQNGTPGTWTLIDAASLEDFGIVPLPDQEDPTDVRVLIVNTDTLSQTQDDTYTTYYDDGNGNTGYISSTIAAALVGTYYVQVSDGTITVATAQYLGSQDMATVQQTTLYDIQLVTSTITLPVYNFDNRQLLSALANLTYVFGVTSQHYSAVPEQALRYKFTCTSPFWFNFRVSTCSTVLGFNELAPRLLQLTGTEEYSVFSDTVDPTRRLFGSYYDTGGQLQTIASAGIYDMGGPQYVVLRIPEIEDHAFAGEGNNAPTVTGLGMFKLLAANGGTQNVRLDFTTFVRRPFHPIGKLSKLSITLELKDGTVYDSRGVNNNILFVLKYLVPKVKLTAPRYDIKMLNSDYAPDVNEFLLKRRVLLTEQMRDEEKLQSKETAVEPASLPKDIVMYIRSLVQSRASSSTNY